MVYSEDLRNYTNGNYSEIDRDGFISLTAYFRDKFNGDEVTWYCSDCGTGSNYESCGCKEVEQ